MIRNIATLLAVSALLAGCSFNRQLREVAVDHNQLLAETEDRLMLLNVVRAKERFPMHFSAITTLRGGASVTAGAEVGSSLLQGGGDSSFDATGRLAASRATIGANTVTPKLSGSVTTNPSFDMIALNNEKFQRGIQQPVKTEFIEYLLQQGWKDDLVMALFIEKIEVVAASNQGRYRKGDIIATLLNANANPANSDRKEEFQSRLWRCFMHSRMLRPMKVAARTTDLLDLAPLLANSGIGDLATLDGKTFDVAEVGKQGETRRVIQRRSPAKVALGFALRDGASVPDECVAASGSDSIELLERHAGDNAAKARDAEVQAGALTLDGQRYDVDLVPILRSTLGVFYFLGEYSRTPAEHQYRLVNGRTVFSLAEGEGPAAIDLHFRGRRYFIREGDGRSLQIVDAMQQLLNLQKSSDELPYTQSVTIVR